MRRVAILLTAWIGLGWVGAAHAAEPAVAKPVEKPAATVTLADFDNPFSDRADGVRLWTDSTGSHRVEARFISADRDTVRLQRADKRFLRIKLGQLSMADQQLVRAILQMWSTK